MGTIHAVCISRVKHQRKEEVGSIELCEDHGVLGDAHAGSGRQVSLLAIEGIRRMQEKMPELVPGDFAENITTEGLAVELLPVGTRLSVGGEAVIKITQIGKTCHNKCNIHKTVGFCIMPKEGVFARVLTGGIVRKGDGIEVLGDGKV